ncbi:DNA polymerase III subunit beta [Fimbriimonadia bacterium ATM]|nr:MAG: DNA polymerase III subunit beta [Armatimonadota bacterium]MBC6969701.1 DNA polymerase III subunit beta [Armatimonadota bacterium]MCE7898970.1 DNA polymerase III subunit beta [Armatimonadetes bacterium ATM1]MDL1927424.1 DNA polymerase III subunit beta [Fimbriimonadia bacterium ATM]RIJ97952.1 MAG: DNA polymerase III subunit beta [Armatimonadota bacterium]
MRVACPRRELYDAVSLAGAPATGRPAALPIFQNLLFEADDSQVRLVGCDGEMWVERRLPAMVESGGSLAVGAKLFHDILSSLPDGELNIEQPNGPSLKLALSNSEYRVVGMMPDDFPGIPNVEASATLRIRAGDFAKMVESVGFAVAKENQPRAQLTGVLFVYDGANLRAVATDTHRLAVRTEAHPGIGSNVTAIVPDRALQVIRRLPVPADGELTLVFGEGRLLVESDGARVVSQLISGDFPPYERVIPTERTRRWLADKESLADALKRAGVLARESAQRVVLKSDGQVATLVTRSEGIGEGKEEISIVNEGEDIEIAFNGRYLLDAIGPIEGQGVALEMIESDRAAVVRPADEGQNYFCVIMPMALI